MSSVERWTRITSASLTVVRVWAVAARVNAMRPAARRIMILSVLMLGLVSPILLVFVANRLEDIALRKQFQGNFSRDGAGVHLGVVNGDAQIHVAEVAAVEAFVELQGFAVRVAGGIEPGLIVESIGIHHQSVAIPMAHRVTN